MNFLPFVLTFLVILVIGSTALFSSVRSTSIEKKILLAHSKAKLALISDQAKASFKTQSQKKEGNDPSAPKTPQQPKQKIKTYNDKRQSRAQYDSSKLNLWPLFENSNPALVKFVFESSKRLINLVYKEADFYHPGLADEIMGAIAAHKGETFQDLFPKDDRLDLIYYKMLKGTNTSYPALTEYFKIEKIEDKKAPAHFTYASAPVLQATLGEDVAKRVFEKEKANWEKNPKQWALTKEQVRELIIHHPNNIFDINYLDIAFSFGKSPKGLPHAHTEETSKIMVVK